MSITNKADFFLDFQSLGNLKLDARKQTDGAAEKVAQQFEGLLVQQMLTAMRAAARVDDNQHSSYLDFYQESYDKQIAQTIAAQDRLGVARMILQQMPAAVATESGPPQNAVALRSPGNLPVAATSTSIEVPKADTLEPASPALNPTSPAPSPVIVNPVLDNDFAEIEAIDAINARWQKAENFIEDLLPQARSAAAALGVSAELLTAQAALETGWGKHTMKYDDGRNGFNLFGIKADERWQGPVIKRQSLEFEQGTLEGRVSLFRAYSSPAESLADYVDFIQSSPRYSTALEKSGDDQAYIREIHRAGYATDPDYADKVLQILNGAQMQQTLATLQSGVINHA